MQLGQTSNEWLKSEVFSHRLKTDIDGDVRRQTVSYASYSDSKGVVTDDVVLSNGTCM